jgi:hypothetical protein
MKQVLVLIQQLQFGDDNNNKKLAIQEVLLWFQIRYSGSKVKANCGGPLAYISYQLSALHCVKCLLLVAVSRINEYK